MLTISSAVFGQVYAPPAGIRPARRGNETSILPGGRILAPAGEQLPAGPGPSALALSPSGKTIATLNMDFSLTEMERGQPWDLHELPLTRGAGESGSEDAKGGAPRGLVFFREHSVFLSEGNSGRVALVDLPSGQRRSSYDVDRNGHHDSFTGDLAIDTARNILYVADLTNKRVLAIDTRLGPIDAKPRGILASLELSGRPYLMALSPDRKKLYVTERESDAVSVIDTSEPASAKLETIIRTLSPAGIVATADRVYVSNSRDDSIAVIDARSNQVEAEIPIRIPGLEQLRGIAPAGLAFDPKSGWLLAVESGINAIGVVDTGSRKVLGHIPTGWFPTRLLFDRGTVYVVNRRGQGVGSSVVVGSGFIRTIGEEGTAGSVSVFPLPSPADLGADTELVMRAAGFAPQHRPAPSLPADIRHVVLIVSSPRAFDEVLGDVRRAGNGPVAGAPALARFGMSGSVDGRRVRLSMHDVNVTPNYHAIAERWAFSDNFYAVSDGLSASWASVWEHLKQHGVSFVHLNAGDSSGTSSDTGGAHRVVQEINDRYALTGTDLPQFLYIDLPNGRVGKPRPSAGYPYEESFVVDNDNAVGHLIEFLSGTKWWRSTAVFVTAESAQGGADHIDAYRTLLLCAGPWSRKNYVSHTNSGFSGLVKTMFELLHVPPMDLFDAAAADLSDCFRMAADAEPYHAMPVDTRVFDPGRK